MSATAFDLNGLYCIDCGGVEITICHRVQLVANGTSWMLSFQESDRTRLVPIDSYSGSAGSFRLRHGESTIRVDRLTVSIYRNVMERLGQPEDDALIADLKTP